MCGDVPGSARAGQSVSKMVPIPAFPMSSAEVRICSFRCDFCGILPASNDHVGTSISWTRYMCIDCSTEEVDNTIDLCAECFFDHKAVVVRNKIVHSPTHNSLQFRTPRMRVYQHTLFLAGKNALRLASDLVNMEIVMSEERGVFCVECRAQIMGPPYWYCVECWGKWNFIP